MNTCSNIYRFLAISYVGIKVEDFAETMVLTGLSNTHAHMHTHTHTHTLIKSWGFFTKKAH